MFYGERLTQLRLLYELSRAELAKDIGITEQAIWQFERNMVSPSQFVQRQLAMRFDVQTSYFQEILPSSPVDRASIAFRNADSISRKVISFQEAYLTTVSSYISDLVGLVHFSKQIIFNLADTTHSLYQSGTSLEKIATYAREQLEISSDNSDLLYKLEKSGIYILEKALRGTEDAYSTWTKDGDPFIILGAGKTAVRRHFDLAHELGHLLLHRDVDFEALDKYEMLQKESEANGFASFFLLPEVSFRADMAKIVKDRVSNPDAYVPLKEKYHVSIQAMAYRAYQLGLMTKSQQSYFYRVLARKNYRLKEPLDGELSLKRPTKLRSIFNVIFDHQLMDLKNFLHTRHVNLAFLSNLFQIEPAFFESRLPVSRQVMSDKMVDLSHYRKKKLS